MTLKTLYDIVEKGRGGKALSSLFEFLNTFVEGTWRCLKNSRPENIRAGSFCLRTRLRLSLISIDSGSGH